MRNALIINVPQHAGLSRRLISAMATLALWLFWLDLWAPILRTYKYMVHCCGSYSIAVLRMFDVIPAVAVKHALAALLGTASTLLLWTLLPGGRAAAKTHQTIPRSDYARHFGLDEGILLTAQASSICTVHHDEDGRIIAVVTDTPPA